MALRTTALRHLSFGLASGSRTGPQSTFRPLSTLSTLSTLPRPRKFAPTAVPRFPTLQQRHATSQVSNQPPSKDLKDTAKNAKEEAGAIKDSIVESISGANQRSSQQGGGSIEEASQSIRTLGDVVEAPPREAWMFGAAGVIPYLGTSLTTLVLSSQAAAAVSSGNSLDAETALALLHHVENIQVAYGAIILSFLGAIHWGFEFAGYGGRKGFPRYAMGITPVMLAWPTLLLPGQIALAAQWASFTIAWYLDMRATSAGWTPKWYSTYRFALTAIVGSAIILTLGGANLLGPGSGEFATTGSRLNAISERSHSLAVGRDEGKVGGDIETKPGKEGFVEWTNVKKKEEEEKKKKEEEAKKKAEEAKKAKEGDKKDEKK